ncbi:MAG: methionine--tRNA ligase subunit beta [Acidobacteria bacterium]|nr:MAG: methionine--tRNA ligase subunit beta [Acidobacteriota bacterium]
MEEQKTEELNTIDIRDFAKVQLKVGKILSCERIPKSRKLLKMQIDVGTEVRQILAGLAPWYIPEEVIGNKVIVVTNLKPAKLMGIESQGMVLAASGCGEDSVPCFLSVPDGVPVGGTVR